MVKEYPKRKEHITYKELPEENELLLVDEKNSDAKVLNADAGGVWLLCNGKRSEDDMLGILADSLPSKDKIELKNHLGKILTFLNDSGLLE